MSNIADWYSVNPKEQESLYKIPVQSSRWRFARPFMPYRDRVIELALLQLIRSSIINERSLYETIEAFAKENRWLAKGRIARFAQDLQGPGTLHQAASRASNLFSPESVLAIKFGESSTNLRSELDRLIEHKKQELKDVSHRFQFSLVYWIVILNILYLFASFIWPTLQKVAAEFYPVAPKFTRITDNILAYTIASPFFFIILFLSTVGLFIYWCLGIPYFRNRVNILLGYSPSVRSRKIATAFQLSADSLRGRFPFPDVPALFELSKNSLSVKKNTPPQDTEEDLWHHLYRKRLLSKSELAFLLKYDDGSSHSRSMQAVLLGAKANEYRLKAENRATRRTLTLQISATLIMGATVFIVFYSLFDFLYQIITEFPY